MHEQSIYEEMLTASSTHAAMCRHVKNFSHSIATTRIRNLLQCLRALQIVGGPFNENRSEWIRDGGKYL